MLQKMDRPSSFEAVIGRRLHKLLHQGHDPFIVPEKNAYLCAAYIAHPHLDLPHSLVSKNRTAKDILRVLVENKVLFRSFAQYEIDATLRKSRFLSRLLTETKEMNCYYELIMTY